MNLIERAIGNLRKFEELNPAIVEAVKEGYQIGVYDSETQMIITKELVGDTLKVHVIEDGYFIPGVNDAKSISTLVRAAHQNAIDKGWWGEDRSFGEIIALIHSEASEALEDYRNGKQPTEVWYETANGQSWEIQTSIFQKPCGIPTELADIVIRVFDACGRYGIDLEAAIREKMAYNATRPVRHGGKVL